MSPTRSERLAVLMDMLLEDGVIICVKHEPAFEVGLTRNPGAYWLEGFVCKNCRCVYCPEDPTT